MKTQKTILIYPKNEELIKQMDEFFINSFIRDVKTRIKKGGAKMYYVEKLQYSIAKLCGKNEVNINIVIPNNEDEICVKGKGYLKDNGNILVISLIPNADVKVIGE